MFTVLFQGSNRVVTKKVKQSGGGGTVGDTTPPLRRRGGGMMGDTGSSSSDEDAYLSAAEELSLSPTHQNYETPDNGEKAEYGAEVAEDGEKETIQSQIEDEGVNNHPKVGNDEDLNDVVSEDQIGQIEVSKTVDDSSDNEYEDKYSYKCLNRLDRDFFSSPRLNMVLDSPVSQRSMATILMGGMGGVAMVMDIVLFPP